jgi:hypothetical protein
MKAAMRGGLDLRMLRTCCCCWGRGRLGLLQLVLGRSLLDESCHERGVGLEDVEDLLLLLG